MLRRSQKTLNTVTICQLYILGLFCLPSDQNLNQAEAGWGFFGTTAPTSKVHGEGKGVKEVKTPATLVVNRITLCESFDLK